ncbi:MAG TPA: metallophosphoesterase [Longimicrobium sp.]|nr:metallophosphoesterase [Longimicrobium sp.]
MIRKSFERGAGWALLAALACAAPAGAQGRARPPAPRDVVVLAAGDIGDCHRTDDQATAALLDSIPGEVLALGDEAYPDGSAYDFSHCYDPAWGRFRARTHPTPGNHEYVREGGDAYFDYFGAAAGPRGKGWYSFDLGAWHVVALNSEADTRAGSEQERWLRDDLRAHPARCVLAFWHRARFTSGRHGSTAAVAPLWRDLEAVGAELVVQGHDHDYERFDPLDADGRPDRRGIRSFVVGTGGAERHGFGAPLRGSVVRMNRYPGVLKLTLRPRGYAWEYITAGGPRSADRGEGSCR